VNGKARLNIEGKWSMTDAPNSFRLHNFAKDK